MFSQTAEYALRAMMHLAGLHGTAETSERIAAETQVPPGYLSKILRDLVLANLVESFRGPGGGFVLAVNADAITMLDVIAAVDPIRRIHRCPLNKAGHTKLCPLHRRLDDALAGIEGSFSKTTLAEMLASADDSCRAYRPGDDSVGSSGSRAGGSAETRAERPEHGGTHP